MHGALFTTPLPLSLIAPGDRECSICLEPYIEPSQPATAQQGTSGEWAVRVELVAEAAGLRRCCGHIMGKQCLESHLRSSGPWRRRCPLCRAFWFQDSSHVAEPTQITSSLQAQTSSQANVLNSSTRDRLRSPQNAHSERGTPDRHHAQHSASFTQRVREKLKIKDGTDEVGRSLEEVEQVLRDFYDRLGAEHTN